jgi:hypothetical protein
MESDTRFLKVQRFARALDRCDYVYAASCLSPECIYRAMDEELTGPNAILASYAKNAEWAEHVLERVVYDSQVKPETDGSMSILFVDRIFHGGHMHEYRCVQKVWLDEENRIVKIVHEELPGEWEKLNGFLAKCGIKR